MKRYSFIRKCLYILDDILFQNKITLYQLKAWPFITVCKKREKAITLTCITLVPLKSKTRYTIQYKGTSLFSKSNRVKSITLGRVLETIGEIGFDGLDYIWQKGYKIFYHTVNLDLLDEQGQMIFRGLPDELKNFITFHNAPDYIKQDRIYQAIKEFETNFGLIYNPEATGKVFGIDIPKSANGLSPDFSELPEFLYAGNPANGKVRIKMSGSRNVDERLANTQVDLRSTPDGYVWHHLDDFDPISETCTLQLVRIDVHKRIVVSSLKGQIQDLYETVIANGHVGGVGLWRDFYKVRYK